MEDGKGVWRIGDLVGEWDAKTIPIGKNIQLGNVSVNLAKLGPGQHTLTVTVAPSTFFEPITRKIVVRQGVVRGSTYFENSWTFHVYPAPDLTARMSTDPPLGSLCEKSRVTDVLVTNSWEEAEAKTCKWWQGSLFAAQQRSRLEQSATRCCADLLESPDDAIMGTYVGAIDQAG